MITIYDENTTDFNNNGLTVLNEVMSAIVEEELNGIYKLELEYPITNSNKWKNIIKGNIIKAPTPQGHQLFRIYHKKKNLRTISCVALHIFYDLIDNFIEDTRPKNLTGASAIIEIFKNTQYPHEFHVSSNIDRVTTAYYIRKNPIEALLGDNDNSFINRWGGELIRDNFNISMRTHRGENRGVTIRYGKNLAGFEEELDESNVVTRIMPTGLKQNDVTLMLPEKYIDSPLINKYPHPKIKHIHFTDFRVDKEEGITEKDVEKMLRNKVKELYEIQKIDLPLINYKVDFIELSQTEEYKDYQILEKIFLGDTVTIKHKKLEVDLFAKVIKYKWDSLANRYVELELGDYIRNITNALNEQDEKIRQASDRFQKALTETAKIIEENQNSMDAAIDRVTKTMTSALGGHVLKRNDELLIMDTADVNTATKVWRFNLNGLAYSGTGYNGKFETAITMDGTIVGKFLKGEVIQGISLQGVEILSLDNPDWGNDYDLTGKSNNICRMSKGGLIFHHRSNWNNPWLGDYSTEVTLDGQGLVIDQKQATSVIHNYGGTKTSYLAGHIQGDWTPGESFKNGFLIDGYPSIMLDVPVVGCPTNVSIYAEHGASTRERLGRILPIQGTGFLTPNTLFHLRATDWNYLEFKNGWYNYNNVSAGWCLACDGFIHLQGRIIGGAGGTVIAKIPLQSGLTYGANVISIPVQCAGGVGQIDIDRAGNIIARQNPGSNWMSLDNVSFRVDLPIPEV